MIINALLITSLQTTFQGMLYFVTKETLSSDTNRIVNKKKLTRQEKQQPHYHPSPWM